MQDHKSFYLDKGKEAHTKWFCLTIVVLIYLGLQSKNRYQDHYNPCKT